ncbi:MAG: B12-binding domain-containing radical SAM protein [Spirochaetia bacterium]
MQKKIRKAGIAVPPIEDFYHTSHRFSSLGAVSLKRVLQLSGIESELHNFPGLRKKGVPIIFPEYLSHLKPHILPDEYGGTSFFTSYRRFSADYRECAGNLIKKGYDRIYISLFAYCYAQEAVRLAEALRDMSYKNDIIIGGAGVTVNPLYFESSFPGIVLPGSAETVLPGYPGSSVKEITELPFLWSVTGSRKGRIQVSAMLSRGCPRHCKFCANYLVHGRNFRTVLLREIERELQYFPSGTPIHINFEDDNILNAPEYFTGVLKLIGRKFPGATFSAENGLDYHLLSPEMMETLISLGFISFRFTLGSARSNVLQCQNRPGDTDRLRVLCGLADSRGIPVTVYFICGLENDTPESTAETLTLAAELPVLSGISMFYPVPGIPGFTDPHLLNTYHPGLFKGSSAYPWTGSLTTRALITAFRISRFINLERKKRLTPDEEQLISVIRKSGRLHTFVKNKNGSRPVPHTDPDLEKLFFY